MTSLGSIQEFKSEFGLLAEEALSVITTNYSMVKIEKDQLYYTFSLEKLFTDTIDSFSVDSSLVSDMFVINSLFSDESIHPDITMTLSEWVQRGVDYEPVSSSGEFWMTFADIRTFYGEKEFDRQMSILFPREYDSLKEYLLE